MTVAELARFYAARGFNFIAIGEHSQDMNGDKVRALVEQSAAVSKRDFLIVPGIEYTCNVPGMHILGVGSLGLAPDAEPLTAVRVIRESDGFAVLAHPRRLEWQCPPELVRCIDAVEVWNVAYDGKFLPSVQAPAAFQRMSEANPDLLAIASHDLHREPAFYDVAIEMEVQVLTRAAVLANLRLGAYLIHSRYFSSGPQFEISWAKTVLLRMFSSQLSYLRQARALALRWSA
jgi:hypothetical protein